jgi:hypothetical protein
MNKLPILCALAALAAFGQSQTPLTITQSAGSATGELRMQERRTNGQHFVGIAAPDSVPASITWRLPGLDGTAGQFLKTDGAGILSWGSGGGAIIISDYIWSQTPGGTLAAGVETITLTPCPVGVDATDTRNYAYISGGTGTAEYAPYTTSGGAGSCTSGAATGTIKVTVANGHSGAWTIANAGFREAVNVAAHGDTLLVPAGVFSAHGPTVLDKSVTVHGGSRIGVGGGSSITSNCTDCHVIDIDTELPVTLRNFGLVSSVTQTSGSGVRLRSTAGTHNCSSHIEEMTIYGFYDLIWAEEGCKPTIARNELESPTRYGILLENTYLGDAGDQFISENTITGNTSGTVALYIRGGGGTKVLGNKFLGWDTSIEANIAYSAGISTSQLVVTGNEFDQGVSYGIKLGGTTDWVHTIINGNTFTPSGGSFTCYKFGGTMAYISVTGNTCTNAATVLDAASSSEPIWYWGNSAPGHTTLFTGTASVNWFAPSTFTQATMPSAAQNGSIVFCSNCTAEGASGGTGAFALRVNGAWMYTGGGQAHLQGGNAFGANAVYGTTDNNDLVFKRNSTDQMYIESGVVTGLGAVRSLNTSIDTRIQSNVFTSGGAVYTTTNHDLVFGSDNAQRWRLKNTGMLVPSITDTYDIGDLTTPYRVRGVYSKIVDTALSGGTGDYMQTRKMQLADVGGATGFWYLSANATTGTSSLNIIDNSGSRWIRGYRALSSTPSNDTFVYSNWIPNARSIAGGDAVDDAVRPNLGSLTDRWLYVFGNTLDTNNLTVRTGATNGYILTSDASGNASWAALAACSTCIVNGGNTTGATLTIGTNDAQTLSLETNNVSYLQINSSGQVTIAGNVVPSGTRDIGATGNEWNEFFVGSITATSIIEPKVNGGAQNGDSSKRWSNVYSVDGNYSGILSSAKVTLTGASTAIGLDAATNNNVISARVIQNTTSGLDFDLFVGYQSGATSATRLYGNNVERLTIGSSVILASDVTTTHNTYDLFTSAARGKKAYLVDLDVSGTCTGCGGLPVVDTTGISKGSSDATKILRFEVDGFATGTTRVLTPPNADATIAGLNVTQTFVNPQTVAIASVQNQMTLAQTNSTATYDPACLVLASTDTVGSTVYGAGRLCGGYESASFTNEKVAIQTATGSGTYQDAVTFKNQVATFAGDITATVGSFSFSSGTMAGTMKPLFNATGKIGDTSYYYANGYFTTADIGTIEAATAYKMGGTTVINSSRNVVGVNAFAQSITFSAGSTYNVGSTGAPPLNVYGNYIEPLTELVMGSGVVFRGSLIPATNNTDAIGNTSFRVSNVATVNANISGTITTPSGSAGITSTKTVRDSAGTGTCTLIFSGGILTGGTC